MQRKERIQAGSFAQGQDRLSYFVYRVFLDLLAALQAESPADPGKQQPEIVVDLRGRAHGRSGVAGGIFLSDGYRRGNAVNGIGIGLLDALQELAGICRKRFDVAALAFGIDSVEGEGRLAGAGHAGDDRQ